MLISIGQKFVKLSSNYSHTFCTKILVTGYVGEGVKIFQCDLSRFKNHYVMSENSAMPGILYFRGAVYLVLALTRNN